MKEFIFEEKCPSCGRKNKVTAFQSEDEFDDREDFHCAYCGLKIGSVETAEMPKTEIVEE